MDLGALGNGSWARVGVLLCGLGVMGAADEVRPGDPPGDPPSEPVVRVSDVLLSKYEAWREPGFRFALGMGYEWLAGENRVAPSPTAISTGLTAGWRLSSRWSLGSTVRFSVLRGQLEGLRWSATVEPSFDVAGGLGVTIGVGYAGLLGSRPFSFTRPRIDYERYMRDTARVDLRGRQPTDEPLPPFEQCDGDGAMALARLNYWFTVGDLFATGPTLQLEAQATRCFDSGFADAVVNADYDAIPKQWWWHRTLGASWVVMWR